MLSQGDLIALAAFWSLPTSIGLAARDLRPEGSGLSYRA
jgi:hypothetical protein